MTNENILLRIDYSSALVCAELPQKLTKLAYHSVLVKCVIISPLASLRNHRKTVKCVRGKVTHDISIPIIIGYISKRPINLKVKGSRNVIFDAKPESFKPVLNDMTK